jgi:hypothetical protein
MAAVLAELLFDEGSTAVLHEKVKITAINTNRDNMVFFMTLWIIGFW